jgi:hypothetical protein
MKHKKRGGAWSDKLIYEWQEDIYEQQEEKYERPERAKHFIKWSKLY